MPFDCTKCSRCQTRGRNYVRGRGAISGGPGITIIGEAPGPAEADLGSPFMRDAGKALDRAFEQVGLNRTKVFMTYLLKCHGGGPTQDEYNACGANLDLEVSTVKPKVIVLLGAAAIRQVLGKDATGSVMSKIWDSSECVRIFSFAKVQGAYIDESTGEMISRPKKNAFKVICGPDPDTALVDSNKARLLTRALDMAVKVSAGASVTSSLDYHFAYTEQQTFDMLSYLKERADKENILSFDLETSGLVGYQRMHDPYKADVLTSGFCFRPTEAYAVCLRPKMRTSRVVSALKSLLEHPIQKVGHNGNFDNVLIRQDMGIKVRNYFADTFVAAYAMDQDSITKGLDDLGAPLRPDVGRWWEKVEPYLDKKRTGYLHCPDDLLLPYNACDADVTLSIWEDIVPRITAVKRDQLYYELLMPHYREIAEMEFFGARMDVVGAKGIGHAMVKKIRETEEACLAKVGRHPHWWGREELAARGISKTDFRPFNLSSGPQMADLLYNELKIPVLVRSEKTDAPSVALEALEPLKSQYPFVAELLTYRKDEKFLSSFIGWEVKQIPKNKKLQDIYTPDLFGHPAWEPEGVKLDGTGMLACVGADERLHPEIHIDGAETGRVSITYPALQTIPKTKEMRNLIIPAEGYVFVDADYKGLELRVIAMLSGDPEFLRIFREGLDPHSITASKMFGIPIELPANATKAERDAYFEEWNKKNGAKRKYAKAVNFGIPYGEGAEGLAADLKVSAAEAQKWLDDWAKSFPVASAWLKKTVDQSRKTGGVTYSMNRFRRLPGFFSQKQADQNRAERQAKNTPIQGTGGDCTSTAIIRVHERFRRELGESWSDIARIILEVHDQIVVEVLKDHAEKVKSWVVEEMSRRMPFLPDNLTLEVDVGIKDKWGV